MRLGLGLGLTRRGRGAAAPFTIAFTGLSTDSLGTYAEVGDHASISYTTDPVSATETVKWSNSSNPADAATYGTGASPTDYTAGDGGLLYLHVTDGGVTVTRSVWVRTSAPTVSVAATSSGTAEVGNVLTGVSATFTGLSLTIVNQWQQSDDGSTGWEAFSDPGLETNEGITAGKYYRFTSTATNSGGTITSTAATIGPIAATPAAFADAGWSVAAGSNNEADVTITTLPAANDSTITDVEYSVDGGAWTSSAGTVSFTISSLTAGSRSIRLRAVNGVGAGPASAAKLVTVTGTVPAVISYLEVTGPQNVVGDLPVAYTIDKTSGFAWGIGTGSTPTAAALRAGTGMTDFGTGTLNTSGTATLSFAADIDASGLNLWVVADDSSVVVTATGTVPFAIDTTSGLSVNYEGASDGNGFSQTRTFSAVPMGPAGSECFVMIACSMNSGAETFVAPTLNGVAADEWTASPGRERMILARWDAANTPDTATANVVISVGSGEFIADCYLHTWAVNGRTSSAFAAVNGGSNTSHSVTINTSVGDYILAGAVVTNEPLTGTPSDTVEEVADVDITNKWFSTDKDVSEATAQTPRTLTYTVGSSTPAAVAAIRIT